MSLLNKAARRISNPRLIVVDGRRIERQAQWLVGSNGRKSRRFVQSFHNRFAGERCFIIGNGPSLKQMDLAPLRNEHTFGLNRIYLAFADWGFRTSFLVSINDLVLQQCAEDIRKLDMPRFVSWRARSYLPLDESMAYLRSTYREQFEYNVSNGVWEGSTVTFVAMQLAYYMGFKTVFLIGVDHHFETKGPAHEEVVSSSDDPNHFHPGYFGAGFRWNLPDLETSELAYKYARTAFEQGGRAIYNATVGGELEVFERKSFSELF